MEVCGLPEGQGLDRRNDLTRTAGKGHIIPVVQTLTQGQLIINNREEGVDTLPHKIIAVRCVRSGLFYNDIFQINKVTINWIIFQLLFRTYFTSALGESFLFTLVYLY